MLKNPFDNADEVLKIGEGARSNIFPNACRDWLVHIRAGRDNGGVTRVGGLVIDFAVPGRNPPVGLGGA